jgi:molecular chaperone GrpE (heat shock protein)
MNDQLNWKKMPKLPFYVAGGLPVFFGFFFAWNFPHAASHWELGVMCVACVTIGSIIIILPFIFDHFARGKAMEITTLGAVADKIEHLDQFCAQISAATGRWAAVQEFVGDNAEKTATAAKQIADKMGAEVREFTEFVKKMNDGEKHALRLESEKNRRNEGEWVQTLVRILDHIFALHVAAARSGQPKVAEQLSQFQNTCRGMVQRLGLAVILTEPNEPFNPERHQAVGVKEKPAAGAITVETIAPGYTFQSKLVRPALVRLRDETPAPSPAPAPVAATAPVVAPAPVSKPAPAIVPIPTTSIPGENAKSQVPAQNTLALEAD